MKVESARFYQLQPAVISGKNIFELIKSKAAQQKSQIERTLARLLTEQ